MILQYGKISRSVFLSTFKNIALSKVNVRSKNFDNVLNDKKAVKIGIILRSCGFNHGQISNILKSPHSIVNYDENDLISNITTWNLFQIDNNKLLTALTRCTELLTLNPDYIDNRVKELMTLFTKKDISKLLSTCPNIFLEDFEDIKEKTEYITYFMGVEQNSIVKTGAMQFNLDYIKRRHDFMLRAGYYRMKKREVQPKTAPLNKIFSRNINTYLKLSGLTKEEFVSFRNAYEFEQEQKLIDAEDSDEDV